MKLYKEIRKIVADQGEEPTRKALYAILEIGYADARKLIEALEVSGREDVDHWISVAGSDETQTDLGASA